MKYIRTKDYGICKVKNEDKLTISYENSWISGCLWKESYKDQIQYADTIEELCDEFVCQENNNFYWLASRENISFRELPNCYCKAIFGAIWTDKGLIYVAKMNEKGELELL